MYLETFAKEREKRKIQLNNLCYVHIFEHNKYSKEENKYDQKKILCAHYSLGQRTASSSSNISTQVFKLADIQQAHTAQSEDMCSGQF